MRRPRAAIGLLLVGLLAACGGADPGLPAYDEALAALRANDASRAEAAARRLAAEGGERWAPFSAFVRGNVAFARADAAEAEAARPGGDPAAAEAARMFAEDALAAWRAAAVSRADWPEARRNVERALLRIERLREKSPDRTRRPKDPPPDDRPPPPPPPAPPREEEPPREATPLVTTDLPAESVLGVLDTLRTKDRERRSVRRAEREAKARAGERDW
jgi:hypothetical protein